MKLFKTTLLATALFAAAPAAMAAGTASANFQVSIKLDNSCAIATNPLNFNTQTTLQNNIDASTTLTVTCVSAGPYKVGISSGAGTGATFASRKMTHATLTDTINYSLYAEPARTNVIGDGTTGNVTLAGSSAGATSFTVYGRVFGSQNPKATGDYSDTVTATVSF